MARSCLLTVVLLAGVAGPLAAQSPTNTTDVTVAGDLVHARWQNFDPVFRQHPCLFPMTTLGERTITCGYVLVPEDRTNEDSRLIKIEVARAAAPGQADPSHAIVFLQGGPGGFVLENLGNASGFLAAGAPVSDGDLIAFDQRGTGYSDSFFCRGTVTQIVEEDSAGREARSREALRRCLDDARQRGIAVDAYSTWHNAYDVRDLRRALGYDSWNLWSLSYGTRVARTAMDIDPDGTRAVVLDSAAPAIVPTGIAQDVRSSLDAIDRACAEHPECSSSGSLTDRVVEVLEAYAADPLLVELDADGTAEMPDARLTIDPDLVSSGIRNLLLGAANYKSLPVVLQMLENRDRDALALYARAVFSQDNATGFGTGMALVTRCRWLVPDAATLARQEDAEPVLSRLVVSSGYGETLRELCEYAYRIAPDASVMVRESQIPALLLSGLADPVTPPSSARAVLQSLPSATMLEFPHVGHNVVNTLDRYEAGCGYSLLAQFVQDPTRVVDATCAAAVTAPDFLTRVRVTQRPIQFLMDVGNGARPVRPAVAVGVLLFAVIAFPIGAAGRRLDGHRESDLRRVRGLAWLGACLSVAGGVVAALALVTMVREYAPALAYGVLPWIGWAGWLSLAGVLTAWAGAIEYVRWWGRSPRRSGTVVGVAATACASVAFFLFLVSVGAGPF